MYARYLCSRDALGLKAEKPAARPSARATIGYLVYNRKYCKVYFSFSHIVRLEYNNIIWRSSRFCAWRAITQLIHVNLFCLLIILIYKWQINVEYKYSKKANKVLK